MKYPETPVIAKWRAELEDLRRRPRLPIDPEQPLQIGDVILPNGRSAGPGQVVAIMHCPGCAPFEWCKMLWEHIHIVVEDVDRVTLQPLAGRNRGYYSGFRVVDGRLLGRQFPPGTAGYHAIHGDGDGDGYDEIYLLHRPAPTALDLHVPKSPAKQRVPQDPFAPQATNAYTTLTLEGLF